MSETQNSPMVFRIWRLGFGDYRVTYDPQGTTRGLVNEIGSAATKFGARLIIKRWKRNQRKLNRLYLVQEIKDKDWKSYA